MKRGVQLFHFASMLWLLATSTNASSADNLGGFVATGSLLAGRVGHTATLLADGRVLVAGGTTATGFTATAEIYHPGTGLFTQVGDMRAPRSQGHSAVLLTNGQVLVVGDPAQILFVGWCELFDPATGQFTSTGNLNVPSWSQSLTRLADGRVLVTGGTLGADLRAEFYDPAARLWTRIADSLYPHSGHVGLRLSDGRVLLAGGLSTGTNAEVFHSVTASFQSAGGFLEVRGNDSITLLTNGLVLRAGGNTPGLYAAELFDPLAGLSTNLGLLNVSRLTHSGTLLTNGEVLLAGGMKAGGAVIRSAEIYEPATRKFRGTGSLRTPRSRHTATRLLDGRVLIVGGEDANGSALASAELFDPRAAISLPFISVLDASSLEGNALTNQLAFQVHLSKSSTSTVAVDFAAIGLTAVPWGDYGHVMGRLFFPPGVTNLTVLVPVYPDTFYEADETVLLALDPNSATNALVGRGQALGIILNDEPFPVINVLTASVTEGNRGLTNVAFDLVLSNPSQEPVWVRCRTADGTAHAGEDYVAATNLVVFPSQVTTQRVLISAKGDYAAEPNETVLLQLSSPTNAALGANGTGTILNDDGLPGVLHHYAIAPISSPQYWERATTVTIEAQDAFNLGVNYTGSLDLFVLATNLPSLTSDFNDSTLGGWSPLNLGSFPGPYLVVPFDTDGDSHDSPAFRIDVDDTAYDGLVRNVELVVGSHYKISYDLAQVSEQAGFQHADVLFMLRINDQPVSSHVFSDFVGPGTVTRAHRTFDFMPTTNGLHRIELLFHRFFSDPGFVVYLDNFEILAQPTDWTTAYLNGGTGSIPLIWQSPMTNAVLMARDSEGRAAFSNPFDVLSSTDLILYIDLAYGARVGQDIEWFAQVFNQGPGPGTGVTLTNVLPAGFTLLSVTGLAGGTFTNDGGVVRCDLGTMPSGASREVRFRARAVYEGAYTNLAAVGASEPDTFPAGNSQVLPINVTPPLVSFGDPFQLVPVYATENPAGSNLEFLLVLGAPRTNAVTVGFYTVPFGSTPGLDYLPTNGTVVFSPGVTQQVVMVAVLDDAIDEFQEYLVLYLTNVVNADISGQSNTGIILDNGDLPAAVFISDASVVEGDSGATDMVFNVAVAPPSGKPISFRYLTQSGAATAGSDFVSTNLEVLLPPGQTNASFAIAVRGNTVNEPDENFQVRLTNHANCTLGRALATGTILNDDAVAGRLDHFVLSLIPSPQAAGRPVPFTVQAVDAFNAPVTNFTGALSLGAVARINQLPVSVSPITLSNFVEGFWSGTATLALSNPLVVLKVSDALEHTGASNPFDVLTGIPLTVTLTAAAVEGDGLLTGAGRVTLGAPQVSDLTVSLSSGLEIAVPPSVVVPAGQTNAVFDITVVDDVDFDGSRSAPVTAVAPFFAQHTATMVVHDNESGVVIFSLPSSAREGDAPVQLRVTVWPPTHTGLNFAFLNSAPGEISAPGNVGYSAGATSLVTTVSIIDDNRLDGTQLAVLSALIPSWTVISATIAVADNESTNLMFSFGWQGPQREGMGTVTNFRLARLSGTLPTNLTVNLASSDTSELMVPPTVVIPAGQLTAGFNATLPEDAEFDGVQNVLLTASAPGFGSATNLVPVGDNEAHHLSFSTYPKSAAVGAAFTVLVYARDINDVIIPGLQLPLTLTAAGDHGPVPLSYPNEPPGAIYPGARVNVAAQAVDTNVRIMVTTTNGVTALGLPFDVTPPALQFPGVAAVDVACDPVAGRLYAVVPTNAAAHAGRLVRVAPDTGAVEASIPVGFNPARVVVDDLGRYAYVTSTNGLIRRFRLDTQLADLDFQLDAGISAEDLAVMPGHPEVLAVSRRTTCCSPHHADVVLYDHGVARAVSPMQVFGPNRIEFGATSNRLYGINTESNSFNFFRLNATSAGLTVESTTNGFGGFAADFRFGGGRVYSTLGQVADAETGAGASALPWMGPVVVDAFIGRVFSMHLVSGTTWRMEVLAEANLTNLGFVSVPGVSAITNLVRCGADTIAFVSAQGLGLIHTALISDTDADGLRDDWERQYFGSLDSPAGAPGADPDGDGRTNTQEFQSGTDPTNVASVLRITSAGLGGADRVITFPTVIGKRYRLLRAPTLFSVWQTVKDNIVGTGGAISISDANSGAQAESYYRIQSLP